MREFGLFNARFGAAAFGLQEAEQLFHNFEAPRLYEEAIKRGEASIAQGGALAAETGLHTGRSPRDKFIVRDAMTESAVWWENSNAMTPAAFDALHDGMLAHAAGRTLFVQDLFAGGQTDTCLKVKVFAEYAWHSLFAKTLLRRKERLEPADFIPDLTILNLPSFAADPDNHGCRSKTVVAIDFSRKLILIGGTGYAGEMKKALFTYLNFILPEKSVLPMHCSANAGGDGQSALFFGFSGTGKTVLSADASRRLIGDDEHGWSNEGIFNLEGGCYAKAKGLSREDEPEIAAASERFGAIMENVVLYPLTRTPDFDDRTITENTRIAYPLTFLSNAAAGTVHAHPKHIVMLSCDAYGVLPPIAKLDAAQAMYHFLSGYTAKVAGTEDEVSEPQTVFTACYGGAFMPRHPLDYGSLLRDLIDKHKVDCWLVNTGWTGGKFGAGRRIPLKMTRALLKYALDGGLSGADFRIDPYFGIRVPASVPGIDPNFLNPARAWSCAHEYAAAAKRLVAMFQKNFAKFEAQVEAQIREAQPCVQMAAE